MIVFTATSLHSEQVYVGTARENVEEEWASLMAQAEAGASGSFFQLLRSHGVAAFAVEVWAFADNPGEARESMREAREELGAEAIKSSRSGGAAAVVNKGSKSSADAVKALLASLAEDDGPADEDALFEAADWRSASTRGVREEGGQAAAGAAVQPPQCPRPAAATVLPERQDAVVTAEAAEDDEARLQQRIELMKAAQARLLQEREVQRGREGHAAPQATTPGQVPVRLPEGRSTSSTKEKRIREAIAEERERRENQHQRRTQEQYAEMRDVLARIELRRIQTRRENSEKAKVARSRQQQAERRQQNAEREQQLLQRKVATEARRPEPASEAARSPGLPESVRPRSSVTSESPAQTTAVPQKVAAAVPQAVSGQAAARPSAIPEVGREAAKRVVKGGSAAREKRIREAIAQERADRDMQQRQRRAAEADEMAEVLRRLEERTKAAEQYKRRR